jgi:hypothetical protein
MPSWWPCGVDDEHVDTGRREGALRGDVAVDADGGRDDQAPVRVDRRAVERRAQRRALREGADEVAVVQDAHGLGIRRDEQVERVPALGDVVGVDRDAATAGEVAERASGRAVPRRAAGTTPRMSSTCTRAGSPATTTMPCLPSRGERGGLGDGRRRGEDERCPTARAGP